VRWRLVGFAAAPIALGLACVEEDPESADPTVTTFADEGCGVVTCPEGIESCCTQTLAAVTDTVTTGYARRDDLIEAFTKSLEGVRLDVTFDAPEQSASILFNLGTERSFYALQVTAARDGASDAYVTALVSDALRRGCVFGGELPAAINGRAAADASREIELSSDEFCFNGGLPGRGSVIELGLRATGPGAASLEIVDLELRSVGRID
jgi:hypothetical protein